MISLVDPLEELRSRIGLPTPLPAGPMPLLVQWFTEANRSAQQPNPDAMILATASSSGAPSARVVLCKSIESDAAALVFFTNYTSRKATEIESNPRVAGVFHWDHAGRQARVEGCVQRVSDAESDEYFQKRPLLSRLSAWASEQGRPMARRGELIDRVRAAMKQFGVGMHHLALPGSAPVIPRPQHWGGYRVQIDSVELWLGGSGRLHDRAIWQRDRTAIPPIWSATRIQP